jgi:hypothetical protein
MWTADSPDGEERVCARTYEALLMEIEDAIWEDTPREPQWLVVLVVASAIITATLAVVAFT